MNVVSVFVRCPNQVGRAFALLAIALALWAVPALAQATGSIAGTVHDPSGAVVASAKVVARSIATGYQRSVKTSGSGDYAIPLLPPDDYEVKIEAPGFQTLVLPSVRVLVTETTFLNSTLAIGRASETVTVNAAPQIHKDGPQL